MYKKDLHRIEDAIIPFILESLMLSHIRELPERENGYKEALKLLSVDIAENLNTQKLLKRASKIENKVLKYWQDNGQEIRKAYMVMSYLSSLLDEHEVVALSAGTKEVLLDINNIIRKAYKDEGIVKQDLSAEKQMPKVLRILQKEGLF